MLREEAENVIMNWLLDVFSEDQQQQGSYSRRLLARSLLHTIETEIGMSPPEIEIDDIDNNRKLNARIWE